MHPVPKTHADDFRNRLLYRLSQELRSVLCKDISKRLIEQTAYKSFEKHWEQIDTRLDIYGPQARKGGSCSGPKSQELASPLKSDGTSSKHRTSAGMQSPVRALPPARYRIPLLVGLRQPRRSFSNMNRGRRPDNRSGASRQKSGRGREEERKGRGRRDKRKSVSSNDESPDPERKKHTKTIKRVISSSSEAERPDLQTDTSAHRLDSSVTAASSSSSSSSSNSSSSSSSSSEYSSQSESEQEQDGESKTISPYHIPADSSATRSEEISCVNIGNKLLLDSQRGGERKDSLLTPDLAPSKQKSSSPREDSDSDFGATYSPPPPVKTDGAYSWNLNGGETAPSFSANDPASWSKDPSFLKKYTPALKRQQPPQSRRFPKRPPWEQERVRDRFLEEGGFDEEDTRMLQYTFVRMKTENSLLLKSVNYAYHPLKPETSLPALTLKEQLPQIKRKRNHKQVPPPLATREHLTGSVRTEGLYRLTLEEKLIQRGQLGNTERLRGWKENFDVIQTSRDSRATQRRLATELGWADINSDFAKNLRTRKKMLCFAKSTIHNWGLFTLEPIAVDELVIEYIGECIRSSIGDVRERRYLEVGIGCSYMFRVDSDYIIDATKKGNLARFINHSCDPNCYAKIIPVGTEKRIAIYSKRDIEVNEEITYDYKFPLEDEKIPCYCGASACRGTLN